MRKIIFISITVIFSVFFNNASGQNNFKKGSLNLAGHIIEENIGEAKSKITIKYGVDVFILNSDSLGDFNALLKGGLEYQVLFSRQGYKSKLILVDTRNSGENDEGYEVPLEITLEKGKDGKEKLIPVGSIFYNKETDLYETSPYHVPIEKK